MNEGWKDKWRIYIIRMKKDMRNKDELHWWMKDKKDELMNEEYKDEVNEGYKDELMNEGWIDEWRI